MPAVFLIPWEILARISEHDSHHLPLPLHGRATTRGISATQAGIERGALWQQAFLLNRCHPSLLPCLLPEPVFLPPLRHPLCSHHPPAISHTPSYGENGVLFYSDLPKTTG